MSLCWRMWFLPESLKLTAGVNTQWVKTFVHSFESLGVVLSHTKYEHLHLIPWLTKVLLLDWTQPQNHVQLANQPEILFLEFKQYIQQVIIKSLVQMSQYFIFLYRVRYPWHSILEPNKIVSKLHGFDLGSWLISLMINDVKAKGIHWANFITWGYFEHLKLSSIHVFSMARELLSRDVRITDSWSVTQ